jgi:hypothetical protein
MRTETSEGEMTPLVRAIQKLSLRACRDDHRPVTATVNTYGGFDLTDEHQRRVRIAQADPDAGVELYVLDRNDCLVSDARLGIGFPPAVIASVVRDAFLVR